MWAAAKKWAKWGLMGCGGLFVLAMCSVALSPKSDQPGARAASAPAPEQIAAHIAVIDQARQACSARVQVLGQVMGEGDAVRAIGLARNARSACDEGFSAVYDLKPARGAPAAWADTLTDCQTALRLWSDMTKAAEALAENASSPTAMHEAQQAVTAATRADARCAEQAAALSAS